MGKEKGKGRKIFLFVFDSAKRRALLCAENEKEKEGEKRRFRDSSLLNRTGSEGKGGRGGKETPLFLLARGKKGRALPKKKGPQRTEKPPEEERRVPLVPSLPLLQRGGREKRKGGNPIEMMKDRPSLTERTQERKGKRDSSPSSEKEKERKTSASASSCYCGEREKGGDVSLGPRRILAVRLWRRGRKREKRGFLILVRKTCSASPLSGGREGRKKRGVLLRVCAGAAGGRPLPSSLLLMKGREKKGVFHMRRHLFAPRNWEAEKRRRQSYLY